MNLEKLDQVIAYIEEHPDQHDQAIYIGSSGCGTVACLAGWTCLLNGWEPIHLDMGERVRVQRRGETRLVTEVAQEILGLTDKQNYRYFYEAQNLDDIKLLRAMENVA